MSDIDVSELRALSHDLGALGLKSTAAMFDVFKQGANDLRDQWKSNARATAGTHGKHYPNSITVDSRVGVNIEMEIGPDPSMKQGGMSFEYGSVNQPPHLDGQKAADSSLPGIEKKIDDALGKLLGGL